MRDFLSHAREFTPGKEDRFYLFALGESFLESSQNTTNENNMYLSISFFFFFFNNNDVICAPSIH